MMHTGHLSKLAMIALISTIPSRSSSEVTIQQTVIIGVVSHVDENSLMHIGSVKIMTSNFPVRDSYTLREWALEVSPEALATLVEGREVNCHLVYEAEAHLVTTCTILFRSGFRERGFPLTGHLSHLALSLGLGRMKCSAEDAQWLLEDPNHSAQSISREQCLMGEN
jgi:hypothetical protein